MSIKLNPNGSICGDAQSVRLCDEGQPPPPCPDCDDGTPSSISIVVSGIKICPCIPFYNTRVWEVIEGGINGTWWLKAEQDSACRYKAVIGRIQQRYYEESTCEPLNADEPRDIVAHLTIGNSGLAVTIVGGITIFSGSVSRGGNRECKAGRSYTIDRSTSCGGSQRFAGGSVTVLL